MVECTGKYVVCGQRNAGVLEMAQQPAKIFIGNIIHCPKKFSIKVYQPGYIAVRGKKILAVGNGEVPLEEVLSNLNLDIKKVEQIILSDSQILIPGLIDTHIHAPQYPNVGLGYDKTLLDWLECYTYKLEKQYSDQDYCKKVFDAVVRKTLDHGTTTACYFASMFTNSSLILADSALHHGQRAFIGKINMTNLAPEDYIETPDESITNTVEFIKTIKGKNTELVQPIITPRFCLSVDMDLMQKLAFLAKEYDLNIQTHISENVDEVKMVDDVYGIPYANVYQEARLLTPKTVLAHGIYLSDAELKVISKHGASVAHCPQSNTCLKSGLCDVKRLVSAGINVGLGTDVSGGPSPSIINAMKGALDVSIHLSFTKQDYEPLNYMDAFYLATLGGAEALAIDERVGNFTTGKDFDALIVDLNVDKSNVDYLLECSPVELLQKLIYCGDDRNVVSVYVAGRLVK